MIKRKPNRDTFIMIAAMVHSQGYVIDKHFYCLEFAYSDILNNQHLFLVESPWSYSCIKYHYPKLPLTVSVNTPGETVSYKYVIKFLRNQYKNLKKWIPNEKVIFGYKGRCFQSNILRHARVPHTVNVESLGVPSIDQLMEMYPDEDMKCDSHPKQEKRCAELILRIVRRYMNEQKLSI